MKAELKRMKATHVMLYNMQWACVCALTSPCARARALNQRSNRKLRWWPMLSHAHTQFANHSTRVFLVFRQWSKLGSCIKYDFSLFVCVCVFTSVFFISHLSTRWRFNFSTLQLKHQMYSIVGDRVVCFHRTTCN